MSPHEIVLTFPPSEEPVATRDGERLLREAARALRLPPERVACARARRISFDARPRHREWRVSVDVWLAGEPVPEPPATTPPTYAAPAPDAPHAVVVGSGPAGLFCALDLCAAGVRVTVLDRGGDVQARRRSLARAQSRGWLRPRQQLLLRRGRCGHVLRRQAVHARGQEARRARRAGDARRPWRVAGDPRELAPSRRVEPPARGRSRAPRDDPALGGSGAVRRAGRGARRRGGGARPACECARSTGRGLPSRSSPPMRWCSRPATAPSTCSRWRAAVARGSSRRASRWGCGSSTPSRGWTRTSTAGSASHTSYRRRSTSWRTRSTGAASTASACAPAASSCRRRRRRTGSS